MAKKNEKSRASAWVDPDDAPELTEEFFDHAEIRHGDKIIRRRRPPLKNPKRRFAGLGRNPD